MDRNNRAALLVLGAVVLFPFRNILRVPIDISRGRPFRIDLPLPYLQLDVVLVSDPQQIQILRQDADFGRLHQVPSDEMPGWARLYFAGTRFHDTVRDQWFVPMDAANSTTRYTKRRGTIAERLTEEWYSPADIQNIIGLLKSHAPDGELGEAMVPIVNSRFLQGHKNIPSQVVYDARSVLNSPPDALKPFNYGKACKAAQRVVEFCANSAPIEGLNVIDVAHNIGATANAVVKALTILRDNMDSNLTELFTKPQNTPTPTVPRIALAASTFNGLLAYPAVPRKTMFLISISKAAGKTGSLYYTFGTGVPERSCAFKPFIMSFLKDVQAKYQS